MSKGLLSEEPPRIRRRIRSAPALCHDTKSFFFFPRLIASRLREIASMWRFEYSSIQVLAPGLLHIYLNPPCATSTVLIAFQHRRIELEITGYPAWPWKGAYNLGRPLSCYPYGASHYGQAR